MGINMVSLTYEQARMEFFIAQRDAAARRFRYWAVRARGASYNSQCFVNVDNAVDEWNYYNDVIGMLGGAKQDCMRP